MRKVLVLVAMIFMAATVVNASVIYETIDIVPDPVIISTPIASINANYLLGVFSPVGGDYGLGTLSINDTAQVVVEDIYNVQTTYAANAYMLNVPLFADNSVGVIANGLFANGTLAINGLLSANILTLQLTELYNNSGILAGTGTLEVTGGSLAADFGPLGELVQITFAVSPSSIDDFSQGFTGISNITLTPIPEPVTLLVLGLGGLVALRKRK